MALTTSAFFFDAQLDDFQLKRVETVYIVM